MIGYIQGVVKAVNAKQILVLTSSGVGYSVFPAGSLLAETKLGEKLEFFTHLIVREQELTLYGFATQTEQTFFEKIITVSGVGPKMGLQILSQPLNEWLAAVESGEVDYITRTPGIGKKMAQKIILELKGKLDLSAGAAIASSSQREAVEALKSLGYDQGTVNAVLAQAPEGADTEALVKFFLSHA
ncbi:Holliday junction branch migration protein RuvA [bacterium]|nr:Holliday junction branch migration protein RuvA [bacterium]NCQ55280.1 Holliday junction branch migration protein RuvA [Candidatus Parcubacteria bacterium]NCS67207.1 Holliday junction branch migration protein RuvA [Candidatus Peregrinibacteria bacterium]NCS96462.1 Holliday junction branch migration protein RuvA [bacterium]